MKRISIRLKLFSIIIGIGLIFGILIAFYSPYQSKNLGEEILHKDAEFISQLLSDNLALGMQTMIFDDGEALDQTLSLVDKKGDRTASVARVWVYDAQFRYITGLNVDSAQSDHPKIQGLVFEDQKDFIRAWIPMNDIDESILGFVCIDFTKSYLTESAERDAGYSLMLAFLFLIVTSIPATYLINKMVKNINRIVRALSEVSRGNVDVKVEAMSRDEIGELAHSTSALISATELLSSAADQIGQGHYDVAYEVRSEKDVLGKSMLRMRDNLQKMTEKNKMEDWLKTGQTEFGEKIRGDQNVSELAQNILNYVAKYIDAHIGTIYLLSADGEKLKLQGSYAYKKRKNLSGEYSIGEGIIGQCALEKSSILLTDVPDDYIKINSGVGESKPLSILVTPLLYDGVLQGVIELGSFQEFSDVHMQFLEQISESIAIAFQSAVARVKVRELLDETQNQAAELQAQQEELRVTNEELEEQTTNLRASEEELKKQQEELQHSNDTLQERQTEIEKKNVALETARHEIEQKAEELEQSSRYKSEFLANMSHELRTPLNSIQILSKLMADNKEGNLSDKQKEFARTINSSGSDLLQLINEILDLSKIEAGKMVLNMEEMSLAGFPTYLEQNFEHQASVKKLYLRVDAEKGLPEHIITDRQRVEQIVKNLLSNALKFTESGGITVKISRPGKELKTRKDSVPREEMISIAVMDTGIGIPDDKKNLIFQAFQQADGTTSRKFGGTGLGLSISLELARLLGGGIQVDSEPGKGSTFTLYIPEKSIAAQEVQSETVAVTESTSKSVRETPALVEKKLTRKVSEIRDDRHDIQKSDRAVLIVEDDANFAKVLFDYTRERGYKCLCAEDGEAGLQLANQYLPRAILLDVGLPRIDGWTVMERLKNNPETRHIPVYFISGEDKKMTAMNMGAIGFLTKPVSVEDLNGAFGKIEKTISREIKKLLLVEDDPTMRDSIMQLIGNGDISITASGKGNEAYKMLGKEEYDCMILDLGLSDISGFDLIEKINNDSKICDVPIIVYTGRELSKKEETKLLKHADSIIIKGVKSPERLLDEVSLFLHRVEKEEVREIPIPINLPEDKSEIFRGKKVLIVDDDVRNIFALSSVLEEKEMVISVAENGKEALAVLKQEDDLDMVLMDIMMPEMDGYEAMENIRKTKTQTQLPIIALTAKAMKGDRQKCIESGANDYLSKPVDVEKLLSLLQVWLHR